MQEKQPVYAHKNDALHPKQNVNLTFTNVVVDNWEEDATYTDYLFKADIILNGVTSSMISDVYFSHQQAISGDYSPISLTGLKKVTIYSKVNTEITIPTIIVIK